MSLWIVFFSFFHSLSFDCVHMALGLSLNVWTFHFLPSCPLTHIFGWWPHSELPSCIYMMWDSHGISFDLKSVFLVHFTFTFFCCWLPFFATCKQLHLYVWISHFDFIFIVIIVKLDHQSASSSSLSSSSSSLSSSSSWLWNWVIDGHYGRVAGTRGRRPLVRANDLSHNGPSHHHHHHVIITMLMMMMDKMMMMKIQMKGMISHLALALSCPLHHLLWCFHFQSNSWWSWWWWQLSLVMTMMTMIMVVVMMMMMMTSLRNSVDSS